MAAVRPDLRVMDQYPGEHYPIEVDVTYGERDAAGRLRITGHGRQIRCGCRDDLSLDYGHP